MLAMNKLKRYLPIMSILFLSILAYNFNLHSYFSFSSLKDNYQSLQTLIINKPLLAASYYMICYIVIVAISIPGATFMTVSGGLLFGQYLGTIMALCSATIGASILFMSTKMASRNVSPDGKIGRFVGKMKKGFQENAFSYLITLRLMPIFPFTVINIVAALLQIPLYIFASATFLGMIPASYIFTSVGVGLKEIINHPDFSFSLAFNPKIIGSLAALGVLSLLPTIYKKYFKKNKA
ncbi:MAG: hypothetical protein DGJ47_001050 [Rickettsiaceae bacterium]